MPFHMSRLAASRHAYPPALTWRRFATRQLLFNKALLIVGVTSLHAFEVIAANGASHGWLYDLLWIELLGVYGLAITGHGMLFAARYGWRQTPDAASRYDTEGLFKMMPGRIKWRFLLVAILGPASAAWLAQQTFILIQDTAWGMAHLGQDAPSYSATLYNNIYGTLLSLLLEYLHDRWTVQEARERVAHKLTAEAQLQLLRSQLDPHMLFNTLSNVYELVNDNPPQARTMLRHLIGFLRSTLHGSRATEHALEDEFLLASDYLSLMRVRMGDRLRTTLDLPTALRDVPIPAMLLQPIIENAIKHGLEPRKQGGDLSVTATQEEGQLVLRVRNSGTHKEPSPTIRPQAGRQGGFGLRNVQERLQTLCGPGDHFELVHLHDQDITQVTLRLPLAMPGGSA